MACGMPPKEQPECHAQLRQLAEFLVLAGGKFRIATCRMRVYPLSGRRMRGTTLAPQNNVVVLLRASIGLVFFSLLALHAAGQRPETDVERDLRAFYEGTSARAIWVDARGRPTSDAQRAIARLRAAAEDGLDPAAYGAGDLERQAGALENGEGFSPIDVAAFDVGLTTSVLRYFRHLHLGRVNPRALGFHLDHAIEPHDFPERLHSALLGQSFDRVVGQLRPPFAQYYGLKEALETYRAREPVRARQIELAMERLRWLPDITGERLVVVNIPMFYLWGWEAERGDGVPVIGMAAITGRARFTKTPVFESSITSVVFNPDWIVPDSIIRNEILPAIAANPNYLAQHHMEMTTSDGATRIRQIPGPWNALGSIKFVLPNVHGVYLHDTPTTALFNRERRDFSHGCVRVADPLALALWVLQGERDWWPERVRAAVADSATRIVKVSRPPRVVLFYMTAAFNPEDGTVRFADDVYGHDARLDAWLRAQTDGGEP
jgi:murein L,D-transpeptidase YcbB/YkuD